MANPARGKTQGQQSEQRQSGQTAQQYDSQAQQYAQAVPQQFTVVQPSQLPSSGLATAGFVLGIVSILGSFLPILNNVSFFIALLGIVFAIIGLIGISKGKKRGKGMAIAGLILGIVSVVVVLASQAFYGAVLDNVEESISTGGNADGLKYGMTDPAGATSFRYEVTSAELDTSNSFSTYVRGTLVNNIDKDLSNIQVEFLLYDADGNTVGTALANQGGLKAGATWKFDAMSLEKGAVSFELSDVSGW